MSDNEPSPEDVEEERLMRAMSRQGKGLTPRKFGSQKKKEAPVEEKKEVDRDSLPAWKRRQLEKEEEEKKRLEAEEKAKKEAAELIKLRVEEFGTGVNQEDDDVANFLTSPRGTVEKPKVEKETWDFEPEVHKPAVIDPPSDEEEAYNEPVHDERADDERAKKEEERLMKMINSQ